VFSLKSLTIFKGVTRVVETEPTDFMLFSGKPRKPVLHGIVLRYICRFHHINPHTLEMS